METEFAVEKAGGRKKLADMLGVAKYTTYQPSWKPDVPPKHDRYLRLLRPDWYAEWVLLQASKRKEAA